MKLVKKIGIIVVSIILWCVILLAALYAFTVLANRSDDQVASVLGYTPMIVKSDSMAPTFNSGDLIFIRKCDTKSLNEGDIICFHTIIENEYALNTHRIEKIDDSVSVRSYVTKGDNNAISDTHIISDGDIVGKYVGHIAKLGKLMDFLSGSIGFMLVIVVPMLAFFVYQVYNLITVSIKMKKAVALEAAQEAMQKDESYNDAVKAKQEAEEMLKEAQRLKSEAEALKSAATSEASVKDESGDTSEIKES